MDTFWKTLSSWTFRFGLFSIILLAIAFYFVLAQSVKSLATQQLLSRAQIIARAEISNTTFFFKKFGNSVATLAQLSSIENQDADAVHDFNKFVEQRINVGLLGGVVITDKNGIVKLNSNVSGTRERESIADRDFFVWARDQGKRGEYFISKPFISRLGETKGQTVVIVASPVYQNTEFTGVVSATVKLQSLLEYFFGLMRLSDQTGVYMFDRQGELLYSNSAIEGTGSNISELFSDDQSLSEKIRNVLSTTNEGQFEAKKSLVVYSPVSLGTQNWLLIISTPHQEVDNLTSPIYIRQIAILALTVLTILIFGIIAVRGNKV